MEQFGPQLHSTWGEVENQSDYSKYIKVYNPAKNLKAGVNNYGVGKDAKGVDIDLKSESYVYSFDTEALQADGIPVQTKFSSLVDLQTAYPYTVSANDVFVKDLMYNEYVPAVNLSNLQSAGYHLDFDLYKVETWPGFSDLPEATDTNSPEVGTQEYWSANFDISASPPVVPNMWPAGQNSSSWINLAELDEAMNANNGSIPENHQISIGRQFRMQMLNWSKG